MPLTPIDPDTLAERVAAGDVILIDVREAAEFAAEHIPGARLSPLSAMTSGAIETGGSSPVFYCKSGMRTQGAAAKLAAAAGRSAFVLRGGIDAWKRAGRAVATGPWRPAS